MNPGRDEDWPVDASGEHLVPSVSTWVEALVNAGITSVFGFPSVGADGLLAGIAADSRLVLHIATSEVSAAYAAVGFAAVSHRPTAVVLDAHWALPEVERAIALATADSLPLVFVLLNDVPNGTSESMVATAPSPGDVVFPVDGPIVWGRLLPTRHGTGGEHHWDVFGDSECVIADVIDGRVTAALLPPPASRIRSLAERLVLRWGIPAVTTHGTDPFPVLHPHAWLGRAGFVPSTSVWNSLGPGCEADARLLRFGSDRPPEWLGATTARCDDATLDLLAGWAGPARPVAVPVVPSGWESEPSPLARAVHRLVSAVPDAVAVADAGASHRVVAERVANRGRPALMTRGLTPMGWSLAATWGAGLAQPGRPFVTVLGDGAAVAQGLDLVLLARHRVPAVVLLARNGTQGGRPPNEPFGVPAVDFAQLAQAVGMSTLDLATDGVTPRALDLVDEHLRLSRPILLLLDTPAAHPDDIRSPTGIRSVDAAFGVSWKEREPAG